MASDSDEINLFPNYHNGTGRATPSDFLAKLFRRVDGREPEAKAPVELTAGDPTVGHYVSDDGRLSLEQLRLLGYQERDDE